jgi:hypothetical protein
MVEDLEAALEQFREIAVDLRANSVSEQDPLLLATTRRQLIWNAKG